MEKEELKKLAVYKTAKKDVVITVKVNSDKLAKLRKKNIDVAKTVQALLERLADT